MNSNIGALRPIIDAYFVMRNNLIARAQEHSARLTTLDAQIRDLGDGHPRNAEFRATLDRIAEGMLRRVTTDAADLRKVEYGILEAYEGTWH